MSTSKPLPPWNFAITNGECLGCGSTNKHSNHYSAHLKQCDYFRKAYPQYAPNKQKPKEAEDPFFSLFLTPKPAGSSPPAIVASASSKGDKRPTFAQLQSDQGKKARIVAEISPNTPIPTRSQMKGKLKADSFQWTSLNCLINEQPVTIQMTKPEKKSVRSLSLSPLSSFLNRPKKWS